MGKQSIIAAVVTLVALGGCGPTVQFVVTNRAPRALVPRDPATVAVFASQRPRRPYTEVGLLHAEGGGFSQRADVIVALRDRAARIGCDAVVITGVGERVAGAAVYGSANFAMVSAQSVSQYDAVCIAYDPLAAGAPTPPPAPPAAPPAVPPTSAPTGQSD